MPEGVLPINGPKKKFESKDILTLSISAAAFIVSLLTLYFSILQGPQLKFFPGDILHLNYAADGKLVFSNSISSYNTGARPGALVGLNGTVSSADGGRMSTFKWMYFEQSKDIGKYEEFKPWLEFVGWVEPIVIPSRTVVVKTISFQTDEPFELKEGSYRIEFLGVEGADRRKLSKWGYTFHISSDDEQFLKEKTVENSKGIASATLPLR